AAGGAHSSRCSNRPQEDERGAATVTRGRPRTCAGPAGFSRQAPHTEPGSDYFFADFLFFLASSRAAARRSRREPPEPPLFFADSAAPRASTPPPSAGPE